MATFKPVVRKKRADGRYLVYVRCTHNRKVEYLKTDMYISDKEIRKGEISDFDVIGKCALQIKEYNTKLNREDIKNWNVSEIVEFITQDNQDISFSDFCKVFINRLINEGREKSASNYKCAIKSFETFFGDRVMFRDISTSKLQNWIKSLSETARAKESYPKAIKAIFDAGCLEYNDYNRDIIRIASRPFVGLKIPKHDLPQKRAIEAETIRLICNTKKKTKRVEMAKDVATLITYLAGINTVDIFNLTHKNIKGTKLSYNRSKTKNSRPDKAYIEIEILPEVQSIFSKWEGTDKLLDFGYKSDRDFNKYVNIGLKQICQDLDIPNVDSYTFRHSWATIAKNKCGASTELIAFCLNHVSAHKVTESYITKDFSQIDVLNKEVTDFIFKTKQKK